ncbi:hypothetical protein PENSPDRAFT_107815 [Peniophora sp. CONT]|nr:hypothetical protein PENSPDRAFT_107815 [Peniophora sp. CONT]
MHGFYDPCVRASLMYTPCSAWARLPELMQAMSLGNPDALFARGIDGPRRPVTSYISRIRGGHTVCTRHCFETWFSTSFGPYKRNAVCTPLPSYRRPSSKVRTLQRRSVGRDESIHHCVIWMGSLNSWDGVMNKVQTDLESSTPPLFLPEALACNPILPAPAIRPAFSLLLDCLYGIEVTVPLKCAIRTTFSPLKRLRKAFDGQESGKQSSAEHVACV